MNIGKHMINVEINTKLERNFKFNFDLMYCPKSQKQPVLRLNEEDLSKKGIGQIIFFLIWKELNWLHLYEQNLCI